MTKAYTIARFINEVSALKPSQVKSVETLASALSPRAGARSVKIYVLSRLLHGELAYVLEGRGGLSSGYKGVTARGRLLNALRARKNNKF